MENFEEVVLETKNSSETGRNVDKPVRGQFSKTVIGEDLRRAIVALRSVPTVNWSKDSTSDESNDVLASTEYIWRATDLSGCSSIAADWQTAVRFNDCNQRTFLTNNGAPKLVPSQMQNQSEIMRKDSFTVASKRLDRTSDSKCQLVEKSTTSVQMSLFSREKRGKPNGSGEKFSVSSPSELPAIDAGTVKAPRKPPPLPPKPSHLHNIKIKQPVAGKLILDRECLLGGAKYLRKIDDNLNVTHQDVADIYERSLDVLEKDDSDQEFEDLVSPRSDSPERLLEELLDSVPAVEFDTLESHTTPSVLIANNRGHAKTDSLSFDNFGQKSNDRDDDRNKPKKSNEPNTHLTGSAGTDSSPRTNHFRQQRTHLSLKPVSMHAKPATRLLNFNAMMKNHSSQTECSSSLALASDRLNISSVTIASDKELTPEDIFEEIMDSLETSKDARGESSNQLPSRNESNRDQKNLQLKASNRWACDYSLENEWLSIYCDQVQTDTRHEVITNSRISERTSDDVAKTINSISSKSSTGEAIVKCKQVSDPLPGPTIALPSSDRKVLQDQNRTLLTSHGRVLQCPNPRLLSQDAKVLQGKNTALSSPEGNVLQGSTPRLISQNGKVHHFQSKGLSSPEGKVLQGPTPRLLSQDGKVLQCQNTTLSSPEENVLEGPTPQHLLPNGKATVASQDTLEATVRKKPVPPLRETVQTYTFAKRDSPMQDIKIAPMIKCQPLTRINEPKIFSNVFPPLSNGLNSRSELKFEPVTVLYENSSNRRAVDASSIDVAPCDENERTNTRTAERITKTESSVSPPTDRIRTVITRESQLPGSDMCEEEEEEMDLDLEIELSRNLDACTASDVECQSIDKLVTSESMLSSDTKVLRRPKKSSILEVKAPGRLGEILAKKKLKKSQNIENTSEVVWPHRNDPVNSKQVNILGNTAISTHGEGFNAPQKASHNLHVKECSELADKPSTRLNRFETTRNISPEYNIDSELFRYETSLEESFIDDGTDRNLVLDSSESDSEDSYKQTMIRNVRSVEKENATDLEKLQSIQVLSEEVTSQEIVLKIAWPKQTSKGQRRVTETKKSPFRELQLKRVMRISDLDNPLIVFPAFDAIQPVLPVTQQSQNTLRPELTSSANHPNVGRGARPTPKEEIKSPVDQTVATRNISEISAEYVKQTNCRKLEHTSDSAIDVHKSDTVKVLRVPMAAVHKVQDIKDAVAAVGSTILDDLQRQPKKRNIRVTCEAVESKSRASLHDQDVTVIRNTIVDTYAPKPAIVFSSRPTNYVLI